MRLKWLNGVAVAALALVLAGAPALAKEEKQAQTRAAEKAPAKAESKALSTAKTAARKAAKSRGQKQAQAERAKIIEEAVQALVQTRKAIVALEKKDKEATLTALERVIGKLEIILAQDPNLALAPVDVVSYALDVHADVASVKKAVEQSIRLLKEGRVQDARAIVSNLASELVIEITNIPLATYPDAIKAVVPLVQAGKFEEARQALIAALNTLVITRHIIPLPVLRAEQLLLAAEKLAEKKGRSKGEQKQLEDLLGAARAELQFAEVLGYGEKGDFKPFYTAIDEIEKKVAGGKHGKGFFDELKKALEKFREKLF